MRAWPGGPKAPPSGRGSLDSPRPAPVLSTVPEETLAATSPRSEAPAAPDPAATEQQPPPSPPPPPPPDAAPDLVVPSPGDETQQQQQQQAQQRRPGALRRLLGLLRRALPAGAAAQQAPAASPGDLAQQQMEERTPGALRRLPTAEQQQEQKWTRGLLKRVLPARAARQWAAAEAAPAPADDLLPPVPDIDDELPVLALRQETFVRRRLQAAPQLTEGEARVRALPK